MGSSSSILRDSPRRGASVEGKRQGLGRLGKVDNSQVGIFMGYVSGREHALVDVRLYLLQEWAKDRRRRERCGVPKEGTGTNAQACTSGTARSTLPTHLVPSPSSPSHRAAA